MHSCREPAGTTPSPTHPHTNALVGVARGQAPPCPTAMKCVPHLRLLPFPEPWFSQELLKGLLPSHSTLDPEVTLPQSPFCHSLCLPRHFCFHCNLPPNPPGPSTPPLGVSSHLAHSLPSPIPSLPHCPLPGPRPSALLGSLESSTYTPFLCLPLGVGEVSPRPPTCHVPMLRNPFTTPATHWVGP